jgi:hypothetical protein
MSQQPDISSLYDPWKVRLRGARVIESYVGSTSDVEADDSAGDESASRFEILLGIDSETEDVESQIAIVARFTHTSDPAEVQITCIAPLYVRDGVEDDLGTTEGRWKTLLKYSGLAIEVLWDFCRSSASAAVASSFVTFDIPDEMPDPSLVKPLSLKK